MKDNQTESSHRMRTIALVVSCVCVILGSIVVLNLQTPRGAAVMHSQPSGPNPELSPRTAEAKSEQKVKSFASASLPNNAPAADTADKATDADIVYLSAQHLLIPVAGVSPGQLRDTFNEGRSEGRQHQALDIAAPQGTPVLAATDGVLTRLFQSDKGGITLYELDPSGRYVYYYAHLMRYAEDAKEGKELHRGEVIGYVGDTGNAGAGNYHLHFGISKITSPRRWSGGEPINPYPILAGK